jgi:hypothetical protein
VSAVEAPRGVLYHCYELDDEGRVAKADIITPTAQNTANIEKYIRISAERLLSMGDERLEESLELLVRAYDPCISCSAHLIKVIKIRSLFQLIVFCYARETSHRLSRQSPYGVEPSTELSPSVRQALGDVIERVRELVMKLKGARANA